MLTFVKADKLIYVLNNRILLDPCGSPSEMFAAGAEKIVELVTNNALKILALSDVERKETLESIKLQLSR